jgi:hypothetical protein
MAEAMHFPVRYFDMQPGSALPKLSIRLRKRLVKVNVFISYSRAPDPEIASLNKWFPDARLDGGFQAGL